MSQDKWVWVGDLRQMEIEPPETLGLHRLTEHRSIIHGPNRGEWIEVDDTLLVSDVE